MRIAATNWLRLCAMIAVLGMAAGSAQAAPSISISIDSKGQTAPGVIPDPPQCFGPESPLFVTLFLTNSGASAVPVKAFAGASPGWHIEPGSCESSVGTCDIVDPQDLQWSVASLDPDNTAVVLFTLRVDSDTRIGTQLCLDLAAQFDSDTPITERLCGATNSARQCGLGAPAAGTHGLALLAAALMLGGVVILRRRRTH